MFSMLIAMVILLCCLSKEKPIEGVVVEKTSYEKPYRMIYYGKHWIYCPDRRTYRLIIRTDSTTEGRDISRDVYETIQIGDSIKL